MNGSANGYSLALFFTIISIGVVLSVQDISGWILGALSAVFAALSLRHALIQKAEADEEDHQRIEIQFQQLRNKVGESSNAMRTVADVADVLQDNLNALRSNLSGLDNLQLVAETNSAMGAALKNIEDNTKSADISLQYLCDKFDSVAKNLELLKNIADNLQTVSSNVDSNKNAVQTAVKLLQVLGQILKSPGFANDISKLSKSTDSIIKKFDSLDDMHKILTQIDSDFEKVINSNLDSANVFNDVCKNVISSNEILIQSFENFKKEISALTNKIEAYNGLTKATLEQYSSLTDQDVRILEKIADKVNG